MFKFIATIWTILFAPIEYVVTTTTLDEGDHRETWTDQRTRMTQGQLNAWFARVRPDLAEEYQCESIELQRGEAMGLGTGDYEELIFIERV